MLKRNWLLLIVFLVSSAFANYLPNPFPNIFLYWPTRASIWALGGDRAVGIGDAMVPLIGNAWDSFYIDAQGKVASDKNWYGSLGAGYRKIYDDARILGGYVFFDHDEFDNQHTSNGQFWFVSPGLESMGNVWDFRVNGYIPIGSKRDKTGTVFADQIGLFNFVTFSGHQQFDRTVDIFNEVGPGMDGEIGFVNFPHLPQLRVYAGGYYFSPRDTKNITGASGRIEYALNHYFAVTVMDTYDNVFHNSAEAGLRLTFGGIADDQTERDIERRMLDPISRNIAAISHGIGQPVVETRKEDSVILERNNIYFFTTIGGSAFNPALGSQNCTFENPCAASSFTQSTVTSISGFTPFASLYFDPGTYILGLPASLPGAQLSLPTTMSMYGRIRGYTQPASGNERPIFLGSLAPLGSNTLDSFQLMNNSGSDSVGMVIANAGNITMSNLLIGALNTSQGYPTGISLSNAQNINITNSTINAYREDGALASGVSLTFGINSLTLNNDTINVSSAGTSGSPVSFGIFANSDGNHLTLNQTTINTNSTGTGVSSTAIAIGLIGNNQVLSIDNSTLNANATATGAAFIQAIARGVSGNGSGAQITIANSILDAISSGTSTGEAATIAASDILIGNSTLNLSNSILNASANATGAISADSTAIGIDIAPGSVANVTNNVFNINSNSSGPTGQSIAYGIDTSSGGSTLNQSGNTFNVSATGSAGITLIEEDIHS